MIYRVPRHRVDSPTMATKYSYWFIPLDMIDIDLVIFISVDVLFILHLRQSYLIVL